MSRTFPFKRAFYLILAAITVQGAVGCFDDEYVDKDISTQIQIGASGLTIPIGYTLPIYIDDFIDVNTDDSDFSTNDDGVISIAYSDSMDQTIDKVAADGIEVSIGNIAPVDIDIESTDVTIDPISVEINESFDISSDGSITMSNSVMNINASPAPSSITGAWLKIPEGTVLSPSLSSELSLGLADSNYKVEFSTGVNATNLPDATKSINTITFEKKLSKITLDCSISDYFKAEAELVSGEQKFTLTYPEITIKFPSKYIIEAYEGSGSEVSVDSSTNTITITDAVSYSGDYEIAFYITGYKAAETVVENAVNIDIATPVEVSVKEPKIYGTRNGVSGASPQFQMQFVSELTFDDISVGIDDYALVTDISGGDSSTIAISVPDEVESILQVAFDPMSNILDLSISSVNLAGLSVNAEESDDITLLFSNFVFEDNDSDVELTYDSNDVSGTKVTIPADQFISTEGYKKSLKLIKILADDFKAVGSEPSREISIPIDVSVVSSNAQRAEAGEIQFVLTGETSMNSFNTLSYALDGVSANALAIDVETPNSLEIDNDNTSFELSAITQTIDGAVSLSVSDVSIPEEVVSINSALLKSSSFITLQVDLGVDDSIDEISFKSLVVNFPKFLKFSADSDKNYNEFIDSENVLTLKPTESESFTIEKVLSGARSLVIALEVDGLDLSDDSYSKAITGEGDNKTLSIDETISYSGEINIAGGSGSLGSDISGLITITIGDMNITDVVGEFTVDVDIEPTTVDFGEGLTDDFDIEAVLTNPTIELVVANPLDIALSLSGFNLNLISGGETLGDPIVVDDFIIPAKEAESLSTTYKFRISISGASSGDYIGVKCAELGNILKYGTPESIELTMDAGLASVDDYGLHSINIDTEYKLLMEYSVEIPLAFDSISIGMDSSIDGLSSTFEDLGESVDFTSLLFHVEATNALPISLIIGSITPYDVNGESIVGFDDIIPSGGVSITANETTSFTINLGAEGGMETIKQLDILEFNLQVSGDNGELKSGDSSSDQYLQIKLSVELPEGITLDLDADL
ncbi:MAG: hypothetical protein SNG96_00465 [Rikenellaceae bacterium]